jgi:hypothetical protein
MDQTTKATIDKLPVEIRRDAAFLASIAIEDDVGAVVRATGHIQDLMLRLLLRNLERPELVKPSAYSYAALVRWCRLLGEITDELAEALTLLVTIRNPLAHDLMHQPEAAAIQRFYDALPSGALKENMVKVQEHGLVFAEMSKDARLLRLGLLLAAGGLNECLEHPVPRTRLRTERPPETRN